ncbi:MAG TPA: MBL fold metallo-hydrolase [Candidatus Eisenbacteria bacterium]|nr:MBL fold metallo-hydrolase [Candidatus Eisenbacteria bacterium]
MDRTTFRHRIHPAAGVAFGAVLALLSATSSPAVAQQLQYMPGAGPHHHDAPDTLSIEVKQLAPWVYAAKVRYVWTGWIELADGILVIDSAMDDTSAMALADTIAARSGRKPIRYLVNTHAHEDHYGGNQVFLAKGATLIAQKGAAAKIDSIMAHAPPAEGGGSRIVKPTEGVDRIKVLGSGDRKVEIVWLGKQAHTGGDLVVWVPKHKICFTGDLVSNRAVPWLLDPDMSRTGWIATLDSLVHRYRIDTLVPGHGVFAAPHVGLKYTRGYLNDANEKAVEVAAWGTHVASIKGWGQLGAYEDSEFYQEVHFMNLRRLYNEAKGMKTPGRPRTRAIKQ